MALRLLAASVHLQLLDGATGQDNALDVDLPEPPKRIGIFVADGVLSSLEEPVSTKQGQNLGPRDGLPTNNGHCFRQRCLNQIHHANEETGDAGETGTREGGSQGETETAED